MKSTGNTIKLWVYEKWVFIDLEDAQNYETLFVTRPNVWRQILEWHLYHGILG